MKIANYYYLNAPDSALLLCEKAKILAEKINYTQGMINVYAWLGYLTQQIGDIKQALEYSHKSLVLVKKKGRVGNEKEIATLLNNLGYIHVFQHNLKQALTYFNESLQLYIDIKDEEGIGISYNNIGLLYSKLKDNKESLKYYNKSLAIREKIGDMKGLAKCLNNIGIIHRQNGEYEKALECHNRSLAIDKEIQNKQDLSIDYLHIGAVYLKQNKLTLAFINIQLSLKLAQELKFPDEISVAAKVMSEIYEKQGKGMEALKMFQLHITMKDSLYRSENQQALAQQEAKYEYEKQKAIDDAEHDKRLAIEQEEKEKQQILTAATAGGLGLVVVFLIFVFNRLRVTKKQKLVIEEQKLEVEQQKQVVELAHSELEEKNQEIMDSITYAKRIQSAILPPAKVVKEYLQESFILYKPKDIVAGDFYWLEAVAPTGKNKESVVLFAAADCTGHGVPGAMVSVVCNNALNRSVREYGLTDPGEILTKTREIVIQEFEKSDEEVKDGMDIALCSLEGNKLKYAGAHNPLWIIRKGEILETKANKQPIGQFDNPEPYTTHTFELEKGDSIYIFSDGYVDQFGGEKGKKFKAKSFKELLLSIQDKSMLEQKTIIDEAFETWRGNLEQIDDVCIIGVRI
jgi:serine phosphatase RsbU (regulator of sigma subunit)